MPELTLVTDNTKHNPILDPPAEPHASNEDTVMWFLTRMSAKLGLTVCLVESIPYWHGQKIDGLLNCSKMRIYLDKHLKGHELRFVLMHEIAHYILHAVKGKLWRGYWKDPAYHMQLEKEADDYAKKILGML